MFYVFLSFFTGMLIVLSRIINASLAGRIGALQGSFFNHLSGLLGSFVLVAVMGEYGLITLAALSKTPALAFFGGSLGVAVVALSSYLTPRASVLIITMISCAGQLVAGAVIDYLLFGSFAWGKVVGGIILLAGLYLCVSDKKRATP